MVASGWFWLVLAMLIFWGVGAYRRLLALRSAVNKQFALLEEVMLKFQGLVQEATTAAVTAKALQLPNICWPIMLPMSRSLPTRLTTMADATEINKPGIWATRASPTASKM